MGEGKSVTVGVTGKSGVGKSTFAKNYAKEHNYYYLDIDEIGHRVLDDPEVKRQVKEKFGIEVSSSNRKKLGELVFASRNNEMKELADITWEKMKDIIDRYIEFEGNPGIVLDWILLPHTHYFKMCDLKILVTAPEGLRRERVMKRDNITNEELDLRDNASIEYNENDFDKIIHNQ
jgi:dephospho-CoA kinase